MMTFPETSVRDRVRAYSETYMQQFDSSHDFDHVLRVSQIASYIYKQEVERPGQTISYDWNIIELACFMHDVGDHKYHPQDARPAHEIIRDTLLSCGATVDVAERVATVCGLISYSKERKTDPSLFQKSLQQYPEVRIVQDADRIDAIGAMGIARTFTFSGAKNRPLYDLDGKYGGAACLNHFDEKLLLLKDMMKTETGRLLAEERTARLATFKQWMLDEIQFNKV